MVDWVNLSQSSGSGYELISVTATPNTGNSRTTTITVSGHTALTNVVIEQAEASLHVDTTNHTFSYTGGTFEFTINSNSGWTITSYPDWLSLSSVSGSSGSSIVTVTAGTNTGDTLTGNIVITDNNSLETIDVLQMADGVFIMITPSEFTFTNANNGTGKFTVYCDTEWTVGGWINYFDEDSFSRLSGPAGKTELTVTTDLSYSTYRELNYTSVFNIIRGTEITPGVYTPTAQLFARRISDLTSLYLTFNVLSSGTIAWYRPTYSDLEEKYIYYRLNGGTWNEMRPVVSSGTRVNVNTGDVVEFRGRNTKYDGIELFKTTAKFEMLGNITSLLYGEHFTGQTSCYSNTAFIELFMNTTVTSAEDLILPALDVPGYSSMFEKCRYLTKAPVLSAKTLTTGCYISMFYDCTSLKYVKCLAEHRINYLTVSDWLHNVSENGTFVKASGATWSSGEDGIPNNWTIINE